MILWCEILSTQPGMILAMSHFGSSKRGALIQVATSDLQTSSPMDHQLPPSPPPARRAARQNNQKLDAQ